MVDIQHSWATRVYGRGVYGSVLPRRPLYRLGRLAYLLVGIGIGMGLSTALEAIGAWEVIARWVF